VNRQLELYRLYGCHLCGMPTDTARGACSTCSPRAPVVLTETWIKGEDVVRIGILVLLGAVLYGIFG
jgi:hypothetical protein